MPPKSFKSNPDLLKKKEEGFSLSGIEKYKKKEYNALHDPNMKHYFENTHVQYHLYKTGQIDRNGRVIDLEKNKSKLCILDREFKEAEKIEEKRQKEEMEMRVSVFGGVSHARIVIMSFNIYNLIICSTVSNANALTSWSVNESKRFWTSSNRRGSLVARSCLHYD